MKSLKGATVIEVVVAIAIAIILLIIPIAERASETTVTFTVGDKAIKRYDDDDKYLLHRLNINMQKEKQLYFNADIDDICASMKVNNYNQYKGEQTDESNFAAGCEGSGQEGPADRGFRGLRKKLPPAQKAGDPRYR